MPARGQQRQRLRREVGAQQRREVHPGGVGVGGLDLGARPRRARSRRRTCGGGRRRRSRGGTRWSGRTAGSRPCRRTARAAGRTARGPLGAHRDDAAGSARGLECHAGERRATAGAPRGAVDDVDRQVAQHGHAVDELSRHRSISWSTSARSRRRGAKCYRCTSGFDDFRAQAGRLYGRDDLDRRRANRFGGQCAVLLQDQAHRQAGVGTQIVVQDHRDAAVPEQSPVVGVEVVGDENPGTAVRRRSKAATVAVLPPPARVHRLDVGVPLERVEHQRFVGGVDAVTVADLDDRPPRAAQPRPEPTSRSPSPRKTVRLSVIRTPDGSPTPATGPSGRPPSVPRRDCRCRRSRTARWSARRWCR